ncbi:hypothetical protein C4D60_Mb04t24350 [Musa balbisiana]|uniref:Uncharacterized protein n=1 Tax=Musa balbisiana TaxID=52838 RepID=A0A4S8KEB9_MUSBA|nr:hypothetical protein C4D60_Mb04t24350 [Musa balbisiana]
MAAAVVEPEAASVSPELALEDGTKSELKESDSLSLLQLLTTVERPSFVADLIFLFLLKRPEPYDVPQIHPVLLLVPSPPPKASPQPLRKAARPQSLIPRPAPSSGSGYVQQPDSVEHGRDQGAHGSRPRQLPSSAATEFRVQQAPHGGGVFGPTRDAPEPGAAGLGIPVQLKVVLEH